MEHKIQLQKRKDDRIIYFDVLRILATIAVIVIHVTAYSWGGISPASYEWNVLNIYNSIVRWAVPIFVMISGAIFLDNNKKIDTKKLYTKNILRIIIAFIFWSFVYILSIPETFELVKNEAKSFFETFIVGNYHMWFLYMIAGLYIITPILRKITADQKTTEYFLIISFIFTFVIPYLFKTPILLNADKAYDNINLDFGYTTYYVLGYYLNIKQISCKKRKWIYILSILGFFITILGSTIIANHKMQPFGIYNALYPNVFLQAVGIFILMKNIKFNFTEKQSKAIKLLAKYSFGIYLVHDLVIQKLSGVGLTALTFNTLISVPSIVIISFVISLIVSAIINNIPILKKYIV